MNANRRSDITDLYACLEALAELASGICECISNARDDEQQEFESMPEELAEASNSADAIYALDKAIEILVDLESQLPAVIPYLQEAAACGNDHDEHLPVSFGHDPFQSLIDAVAQSRNLMMPS
ncbi:hypothetical protein [Hoeflea sp. EC-HK425]|uniref:hypothetical protein n=1 Tax=Hoeflea sp. EC-HK425 TaxID=2038388 RepID=UPI0012549870|nr:hypothetical protein [Hoeflea sp. EC-HK425]VVT00592.1 hypothetical protein HOE425_290103 [Hoeflea sp. EC-HK425]